MGKGTELECKYLFCSHVKENDEPADDRAWQEFENDFEALAEGMLPNGQPILCSQNITWSGVMLFGGADLEVDVWYGVFRATMKLKATAAVGVWETSAIGP